MEIIFIWAWRRIRLRRPCCARAELQITSLRKKPRVPRECAGAAGRGEAARFTTLALVAPRPRWALSVIPQLYMRPPVYRHTLLYYYYDTRSSLDNQHCNIHDDAYLSTNELRLGSTCWMRRTILALGKIGSANITHLYTFRMFCWTRCYLWNRFSTPNWLVLLVDLVRSTFFCFLVVLHCIPLKHNVGWGLFTLDNCRVENVFKFHLMPNSKIFCLPRT